MNIPYWNGKQLVCLCSAYDFPHRFYGGKCDGYAMAKNCFDNRLLCQNCNCLRSDGCDVIDGIESSKECPFIIDFCAEYEIKL
jgi:hypothetical protein